MTASDPVHPLAQPSALVSSPVPTLAATLPETLAKAYRQELRRSFRPPFSLVCGIVLNGVGMALIWVLLPPFITDLAFNTHTTWAFPATLASWLLSDNFATNVFARDRHRMSCALSDPDLLWRLLVAKHLALWSIIVPPCLVIAVVLGAVEDSTFRTGVGVLLIMTMPFAALGIAPIVGAVVPYHPLPLRERWHRRRELRWRNVRWAFAAYIPYAMIGPVTFLVIAPSLGLWTLVDNGSITRPPQWALIVGTAMIVGFAFALWRVGNAATLRVAGRRSDQLRTYLADTARG